MLIQIPENSETGRWPRLVIPAFWRLETEAGGVRCLNSVSDKPKRAARHRTSASHSSQSFSLEQYSEEISLLIHYLKVLVCGFIVFHLEYHFAKVELFFFMLFCLIFFSSSTQNTRLVCCRQKAFLCLAWSHWTGFSPPLGPVRLFLQPFMKYHPEAYCQSQLFGQCLRLLTGWL